MSDFETTVYDDQESTEVWASALVELGTEDVVIGHSIDEWFNTIIGLNSHVICYFHNLKFDGAFILDYFLKVKKFKLAFEEGDNFIKQAYKMKNSTFKVLISSMGQWYSIVLKYHNKLIEFRDSLKLIPLSVKQMGESYQTKHRKLDIEYNGYRYAGCEITEDEKKYIANDVLVVKEVLEQMFAEGHNKLTIGACCLTEFKKTFDWGVYDKMFPNLTEMKIDDKTTVDSWIRKSYRGGWCYCDDRFSNKVIDGGYTYDVNSLYPSMMHSMSGNRYPVGYPIKAWSGNEIPQECNDDSYYYFIRINTRFYLKDGYLPFIQVKDSPFYKHNECLKSSDILGKDGRYYKEYIDFDGTKKPATVTLTLTMTDYKLIQEYYNLEDLTIIGGMIFRTEIGFFDEYIDKYRKIKMNSKGGKRQIAKLFLNNLYGKMATGQKSDYKVPYVEDGIVKYYPVIANDKKVGYIPVGSAITSYSREFTIRSAQKNYDVFCYSDTDSIHIKGEPVDNIPIHDSEFCHWKCESHWEQGLFVRQKTYLEVIGGKYDVKCAGMSQKCKDLFVETITHNHLSKEEKEKLTKAEKDYIKQDHKITDFKVGLSVMGKLLPKRIDGGIILVDVPYIMR